MERVCPHCNHTSPQDGFICGRCGADLVESGQLISALTHSDHSTTVSFSQRLIAVTIAAASGMLAKAAGSYWILGIGLAAAALVYVFPLFYKNK